MKKDGRKWLWYLLQTGIVLVCMVILLFAVVVLEVLGSFMGVDALPVTKPSGLYPLVLLLIYYGAVTAQTVIHETGHLVCGLLSGYTFTSFRIFSFIWIYDGQKVRFRRYSLAGTAGQCLMAPPPMKDGKFPVLLYNIGGPLMNLVTSFLFGILLLVFMWVPLVSQALLTLFIAGILLALTNGIPMRTATVSNDGYNALMLAKDPLAMRAFWSELSINRQSARGMALKDMPEEWFFVPGDEAMGNSLIASLGVNACDRLMRAGDYRQADELTARMLEVAGGMAGVHRCQLVCNRMFMEMVGENRKEVVDGLYTPQQKKRMRALKKLPDIIRTEYTYALLQEKDRKKADACRARFEKLAKNYPYPASVQEERELMDMADRCSETH